MRATRQLDSWPTHRTDEHIATDYWVHWQWNDRRLVGTAGDQVAQFLNVVGYDTVDVGTLSDSWRSEPNTLVYCKPYMPTIPKGMSMEDTAAWIFQSPGVPAPASKIKALIESAVPVPTGGSFELFAAG